MTSTTDLLRLRAENEALKQSLQHESDVVEAAKEEIIRLRVENANQSEKINALVQERDRLLRAENESMDGLLADIRALAAQEGDK